MNIGCRGFREVWGVDFEFDAPDGGGPTPVCLVAKEFRSGRVLRLWQDELRQLATPPYSIDRDCLFVAYYASAELGCHLALDWGMPANILDMFIEFRCHTNGKTVPCGNGLLGALACFGLEGSDTMVKDAMRDLVLRGGPWSKSEQKAILDYCGTDVLAVEKLLKAMSPTLDLPRALLRGRYMAAAAKIEWAGVPIDVPTLSALRQGWDRIRGRLIETVDADYGVYDATTFKLERFERWLVDHRIPWPRTDTGGLALDDDTFRERTKAFPELAPLRELRVTLSQMRLNDLAVGRDGRNRTLLSAFRAKTSRNQPSNARFIFGPSAWLRSLIQPSPGRGLAYIDWSQQEFGIAAALSGDAAMMDAYSSGDPYLTFAKQARAVPADATKASHGAVREQFKSCSLGVQYGMSWKTLAGRLGIPDIAARDLLRRHRETYGRFWSWSQAAVDYAMLTGTLYTTFGWTIHVGPASNPRSLANFPIQANGAEMLRLACILGIERGVQICAPIHDAVLIEAALPDLDGAVESMQAAMSDASAVVLDGFRLRSDVKLIRHPDRYVDERGRRMWDIVMNVLGSMGTSADSTDPPVRKSDRNLPPKSDHRPSNTLIHNSSSLNGVGND